jgi:inner membrane protein
MSPVTHFLSGWVFANCAKLKPRDRAIVTLASVVPDLDGLGIVPELLTRNSSHPLLWFSLYHHSLHTLTFALVIGALSCALATQKSKTGLFALLSFHLHLVEDLLGARGPDGYQWPIPYLKPFSSTLQLTWQGQWQLNAWPNIMITAVLLGITLWLAWRRGFSPLEMISARLDSAFVEALRHRFPAKTKAKS